MGNATSFPADEVGQTAKEVMETFAPKYIKHFALGLVEQEKEKREEEPTEYQLLTEPDPSEPRLTGYLTKQGGSHKSWKRRFFIALNKADNFSIKYYTDETASKATDPKPRGSIELCWYRVERLTTDEEKAEYGEFSVALRPWSSWDRRRTWYIRGENEEEIKKWTDVFEYARAGRARRRTRTRSCARRSGMRTRRRGGRWASGAGGTTAPRSRTCCRS
jgi:hypothetical protein